MAQIITALALPVIAVAEEVSQARLLSWQECVTLAGQRNPDLVSSRKAVEAEKSRYLGNVNSLLPSFSLSNRYSDSDSASGESRWSADGTASLSIFNMGNYAAIASARASVRRAEANLRLKSADVRLGLRRAFAELLFAQEQVTVSERVREIRKQNADLVSLKYDSGRESKGNMLRAKAEFREAQALLAQAIRNIRVARQELARQTGFDAFEAITATGSLEARPRAAAPDVTKAMERHPSVLQSEASKALAGARLRESKSSLWPALTASYSRNFQGRNYFPREAGWSVSGVLSYPLFGGGPSATLHKISAAKKDLEGAEEDLRFIRNRLRAGIEASWAGFAEKIDQTEVQKSFLEAARQRNEEASVRYSSGLMSFENWEIIVAELVRSEQSWVRARLEATLAEAEWDNLQGRLLGE